MVLFPLSLLSCCDFSNIFVVLYSIFKSIFCQLILQKLTIYCLFISSVILFAGFLVANIDAPQFKLIDSMYFGVSISIIITSLWLITIKHKVLSNVIGFITMENGIFLLSLSVAKEMPIIVNLGVLLDIFIAVFILGMLVNEINNEFDDMEVSQLSDLKDYEYND